MILNILAGVLILAIAFFLSVQGLFSAMIMAILAVLSAAIAFNYFDILGDALAERMGAYAHGVSLLTCFVVTLLALREIFDRVIRGNVNVSMWVNRIGGGAVGLIAGMIITGMLLIVINLLPLPATILMYEGYDSTLAEANAGPVGWSTGLTLGLMNNLSAGSLQPIVGEERLLFGHDDLRLEAHCSRSRPRGARAGAPPNALAVEFVRELPDPDSERAKQIADKATLRQIVDATPGYRQSTSEVAPGQTKVLIVRAKIDVEARSDEDNWHRLPATHFRLVTTTGESFYPVGYLTYIGGWQVNTASTAEGVAKVADIMVVRPLPEGKNKDLVVDWVYRVPAAAKAEHLIFRRLSSQKLPTPVLGLPESEAFKTALKSKPTTRRASFVATKTKWVIMPRKAVVRERLPKSITLKVPPGGSSAIVKRMLRDGDKLKALEAHGAWDALELVGKGPGASAFEISENQMMVQVECDVDPGQRAVADLIKGLTPRFVLDNGDTIAHHGALLFYKKEGSDDKKMAYWYYDSKATNLSFNADFAEALQANIARADEIILQFIVRVQRERSIVALKFVSGDPASTLKFQLAQPLSCRR